ncbi:MAG: tetratricopeptide repeat protein, partial [Bacteroidales bacterium]|nr:tetratricopeptide repeat protein [Bacteroidales bacterium]
MKNLYKFTFKFIILLLIFIYPLNLLSKNFSLNEDSVNVKTQIKQIDRNIELIIQNINVESDSFLLLAKHTLNLAKKQKYQKGINLSFFYIARIYGIRNNTDSASHYYIKGLEYEIIDKDLYAHFLGDLAEILRLTGNYSSSLEKSLTLKALVESNQTKRNSYQVYNLLALNYMELMQYDLAFTYFSKSAELALLNNNEAYAGVIYSNIGNLYYKQYKLNEALEYFVKGTKLEKKHELFRNLGSSYNIIADIYLKMNMPDSTQFYLERAKAINIKSSNYRGLAKTYFEYSQVYLKHYNVDSALFYLNKTINLATEQNANTLLKDAYLSLSEIYAKRNDFEKAYYYHDLFFNLHSKIFNVKKINKAKNIEQRLIKEQKERELIQFQLKKQKTISKLFLTIIILAFFAGSIALIYLIIFKKLNKNLRKSKEKAEESDILKSEF